MFELNERQESVFRKWAASLNQKTLAHIALEEQAVVQSPFTWTMRETGLATEIYVSALGQTLCLTIDDDGELSGRVSKDCPCCDRSFESEGIIR